MLTLDLLFKCFFFCYFPAVRDHDFLCEKKVTKKNTPRLKFSPPTGGDDRYSTPVTCEASTKVILYLSERANAYVIWFYFITIQSLSFGEGFRVRLCCHENGTLK